MGHDNGGLPQPQLGFATAEDEPASGIREHLSSKADLLGAIRLPNTAFKGNAGTIVTTDIIFLQKRTPGQEPVGPSWRYAEEHTSSDGEFSLNEYYAQKPEMMLGTMRMVGSRYGKQPELIGDLAPDALDMAIASLPRNVYAPRAEPPAAPVKSSYMVDDGVFTGIKNGAFVIVDNVLGIRQDGEFVPTNLKVKAQARVRSMMKVRDHVRTVFQTQLTDEPDEVITAARHNLNHTYDSFVREFGCLSNPHNVKAFDSDPDAPLLLSLEENYDETTGKAKKAAIFERRTLERYRPVEHVETAAEALTVSLNEFGRLEWNRMAALTGRTAQALRHELGEMVFENPETASWETADQYLSGNVRQKLASARAAALTTRITSTME